MSEDRVLNCEDALRLLFAYLDGELEPGERGGVERHLHACRSCYSRAEFERRLREHLAELRTTVVPEELERRVAGLIAEFTC